MASKASTLLRSTTIALLALLLGTSIGTAQRTDKPLDLTVLSTSEENVQFVIIEGDPNNVPANDNLSADNQLEEDVTLDNLSAAVTPEAVVETSAESPVDNTSEESDGQEAGDGSASADEAQPTGRMTRRSVKDVGLASIGISDGADDTLDMLDNRLWRGVSLPRAMRLIEFVPESISSNSLRKMSYHVIARQAVPPKGAAENPSALLKARLDYLSRTGRSQALAAIISQLPETEEWQDWHMWKLFYDLMMREDEKACATAASNASTSLDPLWQKVNLLCLILTGEEARAAFSADVLKASGLIDDALFFDVIDVLLRRKTKEQIAAAISEDSYQNNDSDMVHLILMDAAHINISVSQLDMMGNGYAEAAGALRYLADDARQALGLRNLRQGLLSSDDAKALFIASTEPVQTPLVALTRRIEADETSADSAAVGLFLSVRAAVQSADTVSHEAQIELVQTILSAIGTEVRAGNGAIWLPLYAPYLSKAFAASDVTKMPADLQANYAKVLAVAGLDLTPLPTDGAAVLVGDYARIMGDDGMAPQARIQALERFDMLGLLPLMANAETASEDWFAGLSLESDISDDAPRYQSLSMPALLALGQAAQKGQRAEAVILASHLVGARDLAQIAPADHAKIVAYLTQAGLDKTANAYGNDAMMAHIMAGLLHTLGGEAR